MECNVFKLIPSKFILIKCIKHTKQNSLIVSNSVFDNLHPR